MAHSTAYRIAGALYAVLAILFAIAFIYALTLQKYPLALVLALGVMLIGPIALAAFLLLRSPQAAIAWLRWGGAVLGSQLGLAMFLSWQTAAFLVVPMAFVLIGAYRERRAS